MPREKKRRQHGTGAVYQRCDHPACPPLVDGPPDEAGKPTKIRPKHTCRGRWAGTIEAGYTASGARRRITVYGKTEAEAKTKLKDKERQIAAEGTPTASSRTTVKVWSEEWLAMTQHTLRPKPWATDRSAVKQWIVPTIGHKRLDQLGPADVRAVANAQRDAGRSSSTALRTHTTLTSMLRAAILEGHQIPRRVLDVKPPTKAVSDRTAMTVGEALAMLQVASHLPHGSRWAAAFFLGMRQGECLGLTWDCVDLDSGMVVVQWQLQPLPYKEPRDKKSGFRVPDGYEARHLVDAFHLVRPKTRKGFRVIPLIPALREALSDWRAVAPPNPYGLVWPAADGRPANDKADRDEWYALQGTACVGHEAGRFYYPHEARHTTATQLLESGADETTILAIIGHSSIVTSRGYMHASTAAALEALGKVAGRLGGSAETSSPMALSG